MMSSGAGLSIGFSPGYACARMLVRVPPGLMLLERTQRLTPDVSLSRGDLRVHAEAVRIDGTLEARLRGALDAVLRKSGTSA